MSRVPVPGVIDSLGSGFGIVNHILWILLAPVGLDLVLTLAPRISISPLVERWVSGSLAILRSAAAQQGATAAETQSIDQTAAMLDSLNKLAREFNLLSLLATNIANVTVPSVTAVLPSTQDRVVLVDGLGSAVGLVALVQAASLLFGCAYLVLMACSLTHEPIQFGTLVRRVGKAWLSAVAYGCLLLLVIMVVMVPAGVLVGVASLISPAIGAALGAMLQVAGIVWGIWMVLYLYFVASGIVVAGLGPIRATVSSIGVVRRNLWASLGLIGVTMLITLGMGVIWEQLSRQPWGFGLAVIGHAYVGSGLAAGAMFFYWHRSGLAGRIGDRSQQPTNG